MMKSRQGAEPDDFPRHERRDREISQDGRWMPELVLSGLALIIPALAFMAAASVFHAPAAHAIAPVAVGLTLVGLALVLIGYLLRRRYGGSGTDP